MYYLVIVKGYSYWNQQNSEITWPIGFYIFLWICSWLFWYIEIKINIIFYEICINENNLFDHEIILTLFCMCVLILGFSSLYTPLAEGWKYINWVRVVHNRNYFHVLTELQTVWIKLDTQMNQTKKKSFVFFN